MDVPFTGPALGRPGNLLKDEHMKIWIDLDNSPHVLLFAPIIRRLTARGINVLITVREFSQTRELARQHGLEFVPVGRHYESGNKAAKIAGTLFRSIQLARFVAAQKITAAVSHGSRALVLASKMLRIPSMTLYDYEFASCRLYNLLSRKILAPQIVPDDRLIAQGLDLSKLIRYPGLKEEVYVYDFQPDPAVLCRLGIDGTRVVVTLRPPAPWAHYHDELSTTMFTALLNRLRELPCVEVAIPARTEAQKQDLLNRYCLTENRFHIFTQPVDGLSLMWASDHVFSGGGTMTREAALLGMNVYSIFGGRLGAGDESLIRSGKLKSLREPSDIATIDFVKHPRPARPPHGSIDLASLLAGQIERFARESVSNA